MVKDKYRTLRALELPWRVTKISALRLLDKISFIAQTYFRYFKEKVKVFIHLAQYRQEWFGPRPGAVWPQTNFRPGIHQGPCIMQ